MVQINSKGHSPSSVFAETSESVKETIKIAESFSFQSGNLSRTIAKHKA